MQAYAAAAGDTAFYAGRLLREVFFGAVNFFAGLLDCVASTARFFAQYLLLPSMILRRPSALRRRFWGLFLALAAGGPVNGVGFCCSISRNAKMARSIVARCDDSAHQRSDVRRP